MNFWKMSGAGNDFVVVDARAGLPLAPAELARRICPRALSVGADGLIAVTAVANGVVTVDFRNADGSLAAFCGNGARCAARYAVERGLAPSPLRLRFPGAEVTATAAGDEAEVEGDRPALEGAPFDVAGRAAQLVHAGVDHVVLEEPPGAHDDLAAAAAAVFAVRPALEGQVNVTLLAHLAPGRLAVRTWERGAGATLACGSAAWAAAEVAAGGTAHAQFDVVPPSAIVLRVTLDGSRARLAGAARKVYEGRLADEALVP